VLSPAGQCLLFCQASMSDPGREGGRQLGSSAAAALGVPLSSDWGQTGRQSAVKLLCHARNLHRRASSFWNYLFQELSPAVT